MGVVLADLKLNTCLVYLGNIVLFAPTVSQHPASLESVFQGIDRAGFKLKLPKCCFLKQSLKVLGFIVSIQGPSPDPAKTAAMHDFPIPLSVKDVQSFLWFCSYCRKFISGFTFLARPLYNLTIMPFPHLCSRLCYFACWVDPQKGPWWHFPCCSRLCWRRWESAKKRRNFGCWVHLAKCH